MEYYIRGDVAKADKIKAAFEAKAIYSNLTFANENYLYYSCDGKVNFCFIGGGLANIIKTHPDYKELELHVEPKFKVRDWVVCWDRTYQILDNKSSYLVREIDGLVTRYEHSTVDEDGRLWTIKDAKDGDVLAADECYVVFKEIDGLNIKCYCTYHYMGFNPSFYIFTLQNKAAFKPATKEQRDLLFSKIKEAGYEWDSEKKELRKIQPHYDIANFQAGMPVLVREYDTCQWQWVLYSHFNGVGLFFAAGKTWRQCIPFNEKTKHLLGTTNMPSEEYINW